MMLEVSMLRFSGSDLTLQIFSASNYVKESFGEKSHDMTLPSFEKYHATRMLEDFKEDNSFLKGYTFKTSYLNNILNFLRNKFSPDSNLFFDTYLKNEYKSLYMRVAAPDDNFFDVVD